MKILGGCRSGVKTQTSVTKTVPATAKSFVGETMNLHGKADKVGEHSLVDVSLPPSLFNQFIIGG